MNRKLNILIADDETALREILADELDFTGANLLQAQDGQHAVEILEHETIDVALFDIRMPRLNGIEALGIFRTRSPETVCVMLTGNGDYATVKACLTAGAYDFLEKPYEPEQFRATMTRALEKARFQDERRIFLEFLVCEYGNVTPETFRALPTQKQIELFGLVTAVFRLRLANKSSATNAG